MALSSCDLVIVDGCQGQAGEIPVRGDEDGTFEVLPLNEEEVEGAK